MKKYNLCVELTQKEQQLLKEAAARKKMTLSGFVKSLLPISEHKDLKPLLFLSTEGTNRSYAKKNKSIKVYFSEYEYAHLQIMSGNENISKYVARRALQGENVLKLEINHDDYDFVYGIIEPLYYSIYQYLFALKSTNELDQKDLEEFLDSLKKVNMNLLEICDFNQQLRKSTLRSCITTLKKRINTISKDYNLVIMEDL